jgi:hypothetical protein
MSVCFHASLFVSTFYMFQEYPGAVKYQFFNASVFFQLLAFFLRIFVIIMRKKYGRQGEKLEMLECVSESVSMVAVAFSVVLRLIIIKSYSTGMPYALAWYEVGNHCSNSLFFFIVVVTARQLIYTPEFHERTHVV